MPTVSEKFAQLYRARREMSDPTDLARLFIARLFYPSDERLPSTVTDLVQALETGQLGNLAGPQKEAFAEWLRSYVALGRRTRGVSFYPIHPVLSRPLNREEPRVDGFILTLARSFSTDERQRLFDGLWGILPPFEQVIYDLVEWQLGRSEPMQWADLEQIRPADDPGLTSTSATILDQTREDLIALAGEVDGLQSFSDHAGRLLALALTRFFLAQAEIELALPIYIAPAADTHEGVRALAHEAIEVHRALFERALHSHFEVLYREAVAEQGSGYDVLQAVKARDLTRRIFHYNANVVPADQSEYDTLRSGYGDLCDISYYYYWRRGGAASRFLRQLYAAQLNLAKKAGIANSRSQYSTWHYYWLAPSLVETLLLVSRPRLHYNRMLVVDLLRDWRERYGLALLIDDSWEDVYHANFRGLGNPEALNEANQRRFNEMLSERGRLLKNSDDFPWVVFRD